MTDQMADSISGKGRLLHVRARWKAVAAGVLLVGAGVVGYINNRDVPQSPTPEEQAAGVIQGKLTGVCTYTSGDIISGHGTVSAQVLNGPFSPDEQKRLAEGLRSGQCYTVPKPN